VTTYTAFVAALAGLTVTGVTSNFTAPPKQINTADLPALYPRLPQGTEGPMTAEGQGGWPQLTAEVVIIIEPVGQNLQPTNFAAAVTLIDALSTALRSTNLAKSKNRWTIRQQIVNYGSETNYWTLIASVSANG
jgi:hypothetical protein